MSSTGFTGEGTVLAFRLQGLGFRTGGVVLQKRLRGLGVVFRG
jgi:hypothetical protein